MKISTKGRYALRMMVDIAEHQKDGYVTLKDVALRQGISKKYLEQIALHISQAGMLRAVRRRKTPASAGIPAERCRCGRASRS